MNSSVIRCRKTCFKTRNVQCMSKRYCFSRICHLIKFNSCSKFYLITKTVSIRKDHRKRTILVYLQKQATQSLRRKQKYIRRNTDTKGGSTEVITYLRHLLKYNNTSMSYKVILKTDSRWRVFPQVATRAPHSSLF